MNLGVRLGHKNEHHNSYALFSIYRVCWNRVLNELKLEAKQDPIWIMFEDDLRLFVAFMDFSVCAYLC